jgi:hypothetical protein
VGVHVRKSVIARCKAVLISRSLLPSKILLSDKADKKAGKQFDAFNRFHLANA